MPCILKEPTPGSPGIVSFTHNEALWGVPSYSRRAQEFLARATAEGRWLFGVHVQGDLSWMKQWPLKPWQSFFMWPDPGAPFLANVPRELRLDMNCVNCMPDPGPAPAGMARNVDICVISRPSTLKRIYESLEIIRGLFEKRPDLAVTFIAGDPRRFELGERSYAVQNIDKRVYEYAARKFTSQQLARISFLATSEQAYGRFPIARALMDDIMWRARFLMLTSHQEGTPRVIAEAFLAGTPCILSEKLRSGIRAHTNTTNTLFIPDDIAAAVDKIDAALAGYDRFAVDVEQARRVFSEDQHLPQLQGWLSSRIAAAGRAVEGRWFLRDLHLRLACHAQRLNPQIMNSEKLFFAWFEQTTKPGYDPYNEDAMFGGLPPDDAPRGLRRPQAQRVLSFARRVSRKLGLSHEH